ncbi:MAG: hypothetical protein GW893_11465 [Armatimonadetes bacterium]|nr:hypothetical protein [Armatimonadota bacterium]
MTPHTNRPSGAFEKLEAATRSLQKEREFFDALIEAEPVALVVNRIVLFTSLYQGTNSHVSACLRRRANTLFADGDPSGVAQVFSVLLGEITRTARLAAYLCVKGLAPQAVSTMRVALEQIGVYCHIWREPSKYQVAFDTDSDDYAKAFRCASEKTLQQQVRDRGVQYRFMHCQGAQSLSKMYKLLSAHFVHGTGTSIERDARLSCEFVDRSRPEAMASNYRLVQVLLALIFFEIIGCIPRDDLLDDDVAVVSIMASALLPTLWSAPGQEDQGLQAKVNEVLAALESS